MSDKPGLLIATPLDPAQQALFATRFDVTYAPDAGAFEHALSQKGGTFRAAIVRNVVPIGPAELERMPALEIVVALGSGTDSIDQPALEQRSIRLATGRGVNADAVADHGMTFVLSLVRGISGLDRFVRDNGWGVQCPPPPSIGGSRIGIIGLGAIGSAIARRAAAFGMTVAYLGRSRKADAPWAYYADLCDLAEASDVLVVCCPGGNATRHLVDAQVLSALGVHGILVNVARGSVVQTDALLDALEQGRIASAGLDVLDATADQFERLLALPNVILTPHTAGRSPRSLEAAHQRALASLNAHFGASGPGQ